MTGPSPEVIPGHDEIACPNCGRRFIGSFCPNCGQEAVEPRQPILHYVRELLGSFFDLDARLWKTFGRLVARHRRGSGYHGVVLR